MSCCEALAKAVASSMTAEAINNSKIVSGADIHLAAHHSKGRKQRSLVPF
jgi:hypothetical protein